VKKILFALILILVILLGLFFLLTQDYQKASPTVYTNGTIITMDEANPTATTIVVENGKIIAVGGDEIMSSNRYENFIRKDLKGKTVLPGFIDPHTHFALSLSLENMIDLSGFTHRTNKEVWSYFEQQLSKVKKGDWLICRGVDPVLIPEITLPTINFLDSVAPDNPVFITAQSLHSYWANTAAFELAGIDANTPDVNEESYYEKDANGKLTGLIVEQAAVLPLLELLEKEFFTPELFGTTAVDVMKEYARNGNTTIVTTGLSISDEKPMHLIRYLSDQSVSLIGRILNLSGMFPDRQAFPRHFMYMRYDRSHLLPESRTEPNDFVDVIGVKHWYDGSPYIGSMYLEEPYLTNEFNQQKLDIPENHTGKNLIEKDDLKTFIKKYHSDGWQIAIHTQGGKAISDVLEAYDELSSELDYSESRHRLEHCLLMPKQELARLSRLGMTPSYHINHLYFYGDALKDHIIGEERAKQLLPLGSSLESGLKLSLHADQPMFASQPLRLIQTAVERKTRLGNKMSPEEQIDLMDAIKAMTIDAAWQIKKEDKLGSLTVGKYADFIVLDENPFAVPVSELQNIECLETYVSGNKVAF
jgi:predicted amidohydrolase YtcJ